MVIRDLFWAWESCEGKGDDDEVDDDEDGDENEMEETLLRVLFVFVAETLRFLWCFAEDNIGKENRTEPTAQL